MQRTSCLSSLVGMALGALGSASPLLGQAPASAQVWDVRFVVDALGPYAPSESSTQIGLTIYARVGILPNSSASGVANLGVLRVGGANFRITFTDPVAAAAGRNQGRVIQGATATNPSNGPGFQQDARVFQDTSGEPLAGHFAPFRGGFAPQVPPLFLGSNSLAFNGVPNNPAVGSPSLTNVTGGRSLNFGSEGTQAWGNAIPGDASPGTLVGDLIPVYRLYYLPAPGADLIVASVTGLSGRYTFGTNAFGGTSGDPVNLPHQTIQFRVPGPGGAVIVLAGMAIAVRRRQRP